jgi:hypothetical protein
MNPFYIAAVACWLWPLAAVGDDAADDVNGSLYGLPFAATRGSA